MEKITSTFPPTENVGGGQVVEEDNLTKGSVPSEEPHGAQGTEIEEERFINEEERALQSEKDQREAGV